ncbi:Cytochrome P450 9e2, partial [Blattella germanica]
IVAQAFLFFFAGFDSTSSLLSNACYLLAVHPEKMSKLQDEIDAAMRENGGKISYETLHSMKYLDMVISGSRFALMESKIVLVKLLICFDLKVVSKTPIPAKISKKTMKTSIEDNWIGQVIRNTRLNPH